MSVKNPLTLAGIEPATFRFVAQHHNHCATAVPSAITLSQTNSVHIVTASFFLMSHYRCHAMNTGFVVDEAVPVQFIVRKHWLSSVRIIPPSLHVQILFIYSRGYIFIAIGKLIDRVIDKLIDSLTNQCN